MTWLGKVVSLVLGLIALGGAFLGFDYTYARKAEVVVVAIKQELIDVNFRLRNVRNELWQYRDRYGDRCERATAEIKRRCRRLEVEEKDLMQEKGTLDKMHKQKRRW